MGKLTNCSLIQYTTEDMLLTYSDGFSGKALTCERHFLKYKERVSQMHS